MGRIALSSGYVPLDEGTYKFEVVETEYKEDYGKIRIVFETKDGKKHSEQFIIIGNNGKTNDKALWAFTQFARAILNDDEIEDVDDRELVGSHVIADIVHDESINEETGEKRVYAHMKNLVAVDEIKPNFKKDFDAPKQAPVETPQVDNSLDAILKSLQ